MAVFPNVDFSSGAVLLASQQNRFPRGVVGYGQHVTNTAFTTETTTATTNIFTAVANRYYRITYFEPSLTNTAIGTSTMKIKNGATIIQQGIVPNIAAATAYIGSISVVTTFTAGSVTITGTMTSSATGSAQASATQPAYILVEDIGLA